jgi:hypothetical protein
MTTTMTTMTTMTTIIVVDEGLLEIQIQMQGGEVVTVVKLTWPTLSYCGL